MGKFLGGILFAIIVIAIVGVVVVYVAGMVLQGGHP